MKRTRPRQHIRICKSGKKVLVNKGVKKKNYGNRVRFNKGGDMNKYYLMNKIQEEQKNWEVADKEAKEYARHEAAEEIKRLEDESEKDAGWQWEYYK